MPLHRISVQLLMFFSLYTYLIRGYFFIEFVTKNRVFRSRYFVCTSDELCTILHEEKNRMNGTLEAVHRGEKL